MSGTDILDDYAELPQVAATFGKCERTILAGIVPDGLPFAKVGNKRLVHIPSAKEWVLAKVRRSNPPRRP